MSRPKPTPEDAEATAERQRLHGLSDSDISDAEFEEIKRLLLARILKEQKQAREARRRLKAGGAGNGR